MRQQLRATGARAEQPHAEGIEITAIRHGQAAGQARRRRPRRAPRQRGELRAPAGRLGPEARQAGRFAPAEKRQQEQGNIQSRVAGAGDTQPLGEFLEPPRRKQVAHDEALFHGPLGQAAALANKDGDIGLGC